jgi:hypothetical protein
MKKLFFLMPLLCLGMMTNSCSDNNDNTDGDNTNGDGFGVVDTLTYVPDTLNTPKEVRFKTYKGRVMCGYQGWFTTPDDEVGSTEFTHYTATGYNAFKPGYCSIEYWPDMSEYEKTYPTAFKYPDGTTATIFSSADASTTDLHFKWMKTYGIGGAIIQRFKSAVEACATGRDTHSIEVIKNCVNASLKYNIPIFIEYDLSGLGASDSETSPVPGKTGLQLLLEDWNMLNEKFHLTDPTKCPTYLWEKNKPLLGFYGPGLDKGDNFPDQYIYLFDHMKGRDGKEGAVSIFAGTGFGWRTSIHAKPYEEWEKVYKRCAVISPWAVGSYASSGAVISKFVDVFKDQKWCWQNKVLYAPVAFPGFSWRNTQTRWKAGGTQFDWDKANDYDQISREKGMFFWKLIGTYRELGAEAAFIAMFDEIDEGTAIFKCAKKDKTPANSDKKYNPDGKFLNYDEEFGTDYYLKLAGEASKWFANPDWRNAKQNERYSSKIVPTF